MWYNMAMIILRLWSPSPKYCHDLYRHRHDTMISIILIYINVSSHGRPCNKETTIRLLPVADNFNKTWSSNTTTYISSRLDHITSQHALQKQVRHPLLCYCKFYVAATGLSKNQSYLRIKTTMIVCQVGVVLTFARTGRSHTWFN